MLTPVVSLPQGGRKVTVHCSLLQCAVCVSQNIQLLSMSFMAGKTLVAAAASRVLTCLQDGSAQHDPGELPEDNADTLCDRHTLQPGVGNHCLTLPGANQVCVSTVNALRMCYTCAVL